MATTQFNARPSVQEFMPDEAQHRREIARSVHKIGKGALDCTLSVTLDANAASTTVIDSRISLQSAILMMPATAHAAAEIAGGAMFFTPTKGQVVINHANNAETDRTFTMAILG